MKFKFLLFVLLVITSKYNYAQSQNSYTISFDKAVHHEALIEAEFSNIDDEVLELRMSRTSPGRYALHEFAKNVYDVKATDSKGKRLEITRPNPYQWNVTGHDGTVKISYTLFANRGGGTYSQIDETHAHLNIPATFMFAPKYDTRPINVNFKIRKDLDWKIATQLKMVDLENYYAPNLDYFMDSPIEISNFSKRSFIVNSKGKEKTIHFVLHHNGTDEELDQFVEKVEKVVHQEMAVYGELPDFDYGEYTFLACYIPNASGDGMEHRNSTILTSTRSLANKGMERNIGTVSHEFFHAWNVERIRPKSLEPFDFQEANISGELWFAEGFTSYYTNLILCRAEIITVGDYVKRLSGGLNYVWNSPARNYFNPIEMSYQAPFVDAARSVDPVNRENTFISYYSYGNVLGLALDLSLRNLNGDKNLDGFMKLTWKKYGKTEIPYTISDLQNLLNEYTDEKFSNEFFSKYIFDSQMPDYKHLLQSVGIDFIQDKNKEAYLGTSIRLQSKKWKISSNPFNGKAAYNAKLSFGDEIISIDNKPLTAETNLNEYLSQFQPNQIVKVVFNRYGVQKETNLTFDANPSYSTRLIEEVDKKTKERRDRWLNNH